MEKVKVEPDLIISLGLLLFKQISAEILFSFSLFLKNLNGSNGSNIHTLTSIFKIHSRTIERTLTYHRQ